MTQEGDFDFLGGPEDDDDFEFRKEHERTEKLANSHPLYKQATEILNIITTLIETGPDTDQAKTYGDILMESAVVVNAKLFSALRSESWVLCMQNAALIRSHAQYLRLSNHHLKHLKGYDPSYVAMFRSEMEKFRLLFKDWASELHKMDIDYPDEEWGLFVR